MEAYNTTAISYNRDVEGFSILSAIFKEIWGDSPYKSPTDMGVNVIGSCISDDNICQYAANQEIIRRYYNALCEDRTQGGMKSEIQKLEMLMKTAGISDPKQSRAVVSRAIAKSEEKECPAMAIELADGTVIAGKTSSLLGAASAALLNTLKFLAGINDDVKLISPIMIEPIQRLKVEFLGNTNPRLHTDEVLIALSICTATSPTAELVLDQLPKLKNGEAHSTVILSQIDVNVLKKLGINVTCEPAYNNKKLYHKI